MYQFFSILSSMFDVLFSISCAMLVQLVFDISDTLNALMAIPNIIALLLLSRVVVLETDLFINDIEAKDQREVPVVTKAIYEK